MTFFGIHRRATGVDAIMNLVVLTAALSSLNAGLYSTGRILHSMAMAGSAPKFTGRMNKARRALRRHRRSPRWSRCWVSG